METFGANLTLFWLYSMEIVKIVVGIVLLFNAYKFYTSAEELKVSVDESDSFYRKRIFEYRVLALLLWIAAMEFTK